MITKINYIHVLPIISRWAITKLKVLKLPINICKMVLMLYQGINKLWPKNPSKCKRLLKQKEIYPKVIFATNLKLQFSLIMPNIRFPNQQIPVIEIICVMKFFLYLCKKRLTSTPVCMSPVSFSRATVQQEQSAVEWYENMIAYKKSMWNINSTCLGLILLIKVQAAANSGHQAT